ncbi:hypothetical protein SHM_12540 [Spiroplasma ixodetis]|uniref:Uncharacterized protein n=1 Tax=Spiroplasma ixodetis TaxID=2141 RepID=A0ABM8BUU4_9MOLU|nr:hypothetical protein SHM_12540 [Spiroplasma ixodetis]
MLTNILQVLRLTYNCILKSKLFSSNFIILRQIWILLTTSVRSQIFKRCGIHIPSQKKSAQQSVPESTAVNISTINYIEQKLWQFNIDILKFIQILVRIDKDLLNSKTFNINDEQEINNLTVKLKLFNPENNQLIGENNGKQQQTTNEVSTETETN